VIEGLPLVEPRSSLKTWTFHILVSRAETRGGRQRRRVTVACLGADRGRRRNDQVPPERTTATVGRRPAIIDPTISALNQEVSEALRTAVDRLPARERTVLILRDVHSWTSPQVCEVLGLSEARQRILLHRARSTVHAVLFSDLN
jgi:RNA polymerase sigma-70 factor (ECF subfamily)